MNLIKTFYDLTEANCAIMNEVLNVVQFKAWLLIHFYKMSLMVLPINLLNLSWIILQAWNNPEPIKQIDFFFLKFFIGFRS